MSDFIVNFDFSKIYFYVGLFASVLFGIKMILFMLGSSDTNDMGVDMTDTDSAFSFFSIQAILAFLMAFGWCGWAAVQKVGLSNVKSLLIALGMGFLLMFFTCWIMNSMKKLNKIVETDLKTLIGKTANAYTKFEPNGKGQIQIEINEKLSTVEAINKSDKVIEFTDLVKVIDVIDDVLYIEKV